MKALIQDLHQTVVGDVVKLREAIENTKGRFFTVWFLKKDQTLRKMTCRTGVKKGSKGENGVGALRAKPNNTNLVSVFEMQVNGYRSFDLERVVSFKCGNIEIGSVGEVK